MPTTTITALADQAATAVHDLTILARPGVTTLNAEELYATTGALVELVAALPQTLRQLRAYLPPSDRLAHEAAAADPAHDCLHQAGAVAAHLAAVLDGAHQALGDHAENPETTPGGSVFNRR